MSEQENVSIFPIKDSFLYTLAKNCPNFFPLQITTRYKTTVRRFHRVNSSTFKLFKRFANQLTNITGQERMALFIDCSNAVHLFLMQKSAELLNQSVFRV